jgi:hypothetical protein
MLCFRDLAARNVLLDDNLLAKVSDFGRAVCLDDEQDSVVDTRLDDAPVRWMAPETLHSCSYFRASDVWYVILVCLLVNCKATHLNYLGPSVLSATRCIRKV